MLTTFRLLLPVVAVAMLLGGVLALRSAATATRHQARALPARGTVVRVETDANLALVPTVRFTDATGVERTVRSATARKPARYDVGQQVELRYDPQHPGWAVVGPGLPPSTGGRLAGTLLLGLGAVALAAALVLLLAG